MGEVCLNGENIALGEERVSPSLGLYQLMGE